MLRFSGCPCALLTGKEAVNQQPLFIKPAWLLTFTLFNVTAGIRLYLITILDYRIGRRIFFVLKEEFMEPLYIVRKGYRYDAASLGTDGSCGTPAFFRESALGNHLIFCDVSQNIKDIRYIQRGINFIVIKNRIYRCGKGCR